MKLEDYSELDLLKEVERREKLKNITPTAAVGINYEQWSAFAKFMQKWVDELAEEGYVKDIDHWVFEEACKLAFGENFFDWYNENNQYG